MAVCSCSDKNIIFPAVGAGYYVLIDLFVCVKRIPGDFVDKEPFKEYIKQSEPGKRDKGYLWHTAIGLQAVDGLKTSQYLVDTAIRNIEGDISIDEAQSC